MQVVHLYHIQELSCVTQYRSRRNIDPNISSNHGEQGDPPQDLSLRHNKNDDASPEQRSSTEDEKMLDDFYASEIDGLPNEGKVWYEDLIPSPSPTAAEPERPYAPERPYTWVRSQPKAIPDSHE